MAKQNFKPQRPARKVKSTATPTKSKQVNKKVAIKKKTHVKLNENLPTHNIFIGGLSIDTLDNVMAGIELIKTLVTENEQGAMLNAETCHGVYCLSQNLIKALRYERDCCPSV